MPRFIYIHSVKLIATSNLATDALGTRSTPSPLNWSTLQDNQFLRVCSAPKWISRVVDSSTPCIHLQYLYLRLSATSNLLHSVKLRALKPFLVHVFALQLCGFVWLLKLFEYRVKMHCWRNRWYGGLRATIFKLKYKCCRILVNACYFVNPKHFQREKKL